MREFRLRNIDLVAEQNQTQHVLTTKPVFAQRTPLPVRTAVGRPRTTTLVLKHINAHDQAVVTFRMGGRIDDDLVTSVDKMLGRDVEIKPVNRLPRIEPAPTLTDQVLGRERFLMTVDHHMQRSVESVPCSVFGIHKETDSGALHGRKIGGGNFRQIQDLLHPLCCRFQPGMAVIYVVVKRVISRSDDYPCRRPYQGRFLWRGRHACHSGPCQQQNQGEGISPAKKGHRFHFVCPFLIPGHRQETCANVVCQTRCRTATINRIA